MVRAGILTWLFASVPLSLLLGRMLRAMPEPCVAAQSEPLLRRAASGH